MRYPAPGPALRRPRRRAGHFALLALAAAVLAPLLTLLTASSASAHNALLSTNPARGATLTTMPTTVVLHFDLPSDALGTDIVVLGPTGNIAAGAPQLIDTDVRQPVNPGSPAGHYTVNWRVVSADGHPVQGTFPFTTTRRAPGTPPTSAAAQPPVATATATSWRPVLLTGVGLAAAGAVTVGALARRSRRRGPS